MHFSQDHEEGNKLSKLMMSKKTKRLYGRMQHGIEQKQAAIGALESKRAAAEALESAQATKGKGGANKKARSK